MEDDLESGDIIPYTVLPNDSQVSGAGVNPGDVYPLLVVSAAEDGTVTGWAFTHDASQYVVIPPAPVVAPTPPAPTIGSIVDTDSPADLSTAVGDMTDADRDKLRAALANFPDPNQTPPPAPTVTAQEPAPAVTDPSATFSSGAATTVVPSTPTATPSQNGQ